MTEPIRIIGIDPGSRMTGIGIVDAQAADTRYIFSEVIRVQRPEMQQRLEVIFERIQQLVVEYQPAEVAVEKVFVHRNADSALKLGQARAAAICATFSGRLPVFEYAPKAIKLAVVGRGGADKEQVQHMVRALLGLAQRPQADEGDALAVALCHAHSRPMLGRLAAAGAQ